MKPNEILSILKRESAADYMARMAKELDRQTNESLAKYLEDRKEKTNG